MLAQLQEKSRPTIKVGPTELVGPTLPAVKVGTTLTWPKTQDSIGPLNTMSYTKAMKKLLPAILAVALSALPIGAFAGEAFAPSPEMAQMESQMHQLSVQARTATLQAITPQHR